MDEPIKVAVQRWLMKAKNDLTSARSLLKNSPRVTDVICFHCQQCFEKCLKSYLVSREEHSEKTHFLRFLLDKCAEYDLEFVRFADYADRLTGYAVTTRYPDDWRDISLEEARLAVKMAGEIMKFIKGKLASN